MIEQDTYTAAWNSLDQDLICGRVLCSICSPKQLEAQQMSRAHLAPLSPLRCFPVSTVLPCDMGALRLILGRASASA